MAQFTICLDPGHGGEDSGARSNGLREADLALDIGIKARRLLVPKYRVVLTRESDQKVSLAARVAIAVEAEAALFVSIHVNAAADPRTSGYEAYVQRAASAESLALASGILVQFAKRWPQRRNRGLQHANFVVVKQPRPACLVECFFLSNPAERAVLDSPGVRAQLAEAIAWGCGNFVTTVLEPVEG